MRGTTAQFKHKWVDVFVQFHWIIWCNRWFPIWLLNSPYVWAVRCVSISNGSFADSSRTANVILWSNYPSLFLSPDKLFGFVPLYLIFRKSHFKISLIILSSEIKIRVGRMKLSFFCLYGKQSENLYLCEEHCWKMIILMKDDYIRSVIRVRQLADPASPRYGARCQISGTRARGFVCCTMLSVKISLVIGDDLINA